MKTTEIDAARLIKYWLSKSEMNQRQLSDALGVTRGRITQMLGKKSIRTHTLARLALVFNVLPSEFIKPAENNYK
tara:strand:- start:2958 stop:3182 length:225 start_codon:yes stop_codon:yes gene_type:complete